MFKEENIDGVVLASLFTGFFLFEMLMFDWISVRLNFCLEVGALNKWADLFVPGLVLSCAKPLEDSRRS